MNALRDILTGVSGTSYAVAKVCGVSIVLVFLGLAIASFVSGKPFDMAGFGAGAGLVVAAMAAAIKLTETSEPKQ